MTEVDSLGRNNPGRPSVYDERRHEIIVEAVRGGNYMATAARLAGISPPTLFRWIAEGEADAEAEVPYEESRFRKLFEDIEEAGAEFEAEMVSKVRAAANSGDPKHWTAAMTILERTRPHKFGRRDTTVVEGGDKPVTVGTVNIIANPEQLAAANDLLKALTTGQRRELNPALADPDEIEGEVVDESAAD